MVKTRHLSIIIPVLNEESELRKLSNHFCELREVAEIIFVDGGSSDKTIELTSKLGIVLKGKKGRAAQMNLGAQAAKGDVLLFLHADCFLSKHALSSAHNCITNGIVGGCFTQHLDNARSVYRKISREGNLRAKKTKIFYGDQGIFVRRDIFDKLGGFPEVLIMEDVLFSKKLKKAGRTVCLDDPIYVSTRRWEKYGILRTNVNYKIIWLLFRLHVPLRLINYLYKDMR